ncbi:MAG: YabP/YqfC family sporulation protein [Porcipelethomonas sp.]
MKKIIEKGKRFVNMDSQIQITGNKEVLVDGCRKILEYNDIFVKVKTWDLTVQIWGSGLEVNDFGSDGIYICGKIQSVELEKNG